MTFRGLVRVGARGFTSQILPGTGRGTMRSMVEGALHEGIAQPNSPSTAFGGPPPRSGEDRQAHWHAIVAGSDLRLAALAPPARFQLVSA